MCEIAILLPVMDIYVCLKCIFLRYLFFSSFSFHWKKVSHTRIYVHIMSIVWCNICNNTVNLQNIYQTIIHISLLILNRIRLNFIYKFFYFAMDISIDLIDWLIARKIQSKFHFSLSTFVEIESDILKIALCFMYFSNWFQQLQWRSSRLDAYIIRSIVRLKRMSSRVIWKKKKQKLQESKRLPNKPIALGSLFRQFLVFYNGIYWLWIWCSRFLINCILTSIPSLPHSRGTVLFYFLLSIVPFSYSVFTYNIYIINLSNVFV